MKTLETIHHKKNEIQKEEFFKDEECTEAFDFTNAKDLYIELVGGDKTPIFILSHKLSGLLIKARIFTPIWHSGWYERWYGEIDPQTPIVDLRAVLDGKDLSNVSLSKYIPKDNAVLFLSADSCEKYMQCFQNHHIGLYANDGLDKVTLEGSMNAINKFVKNPIKKITIFLLHGTQSELQKANKVAKELKEKYGVQEVNLFVLHCFTDVNDHPNPYALGIYDKRDEYRICAKKRCEVLRKTKIYNNIETDRQWAELDIEQEAEFKKMGYINKLITTNSTGILPVQDTERLQVIDAKEVFEEYLNENNLI